jgi:two-component system OmpR family response regulator
MDCGWRNIELQTTQARPRRQQTHKKNFSTRHELTTVELRTYIVEDNATIRENLIGTLEELARIRALGWAETENEAKAWLVGHEGQWDLAIVDLFLKQGSGLGVLEACLGRQAGGRVVVLSNYATADMRKRCAQLGADAVFDKSNEIDALVEYCIDQCSPRAPSP